MNNAEVLQAVRRSLFWVSAPIFFINFALPVKSKALGASAFEIGGLFSLFTLSLLVLRPLIGAALDRFGRRKFFILALVFYVISYLGYGTAGSIELMYVARLLQGIGAAFLLLAVDAITADLADEQERASLMGKNVEAQTRSTFVGATIGFGLVAVLPSEGWQISFHIFALLAAFALFVAIRSVKESSPEILKMEQTPLIYSELAPLLVLLLPLGFASAMAMPIYLVYLQDVFSPDVRLLSWAFLPAGIVFAILPSKTGALVDRFGPVMPTGVAVLLISALYWLMPFAGGFWWMVGIYTLTSVGWAIIEPARKSMTAALSGSHVARAFGLAEMFFGFGAVAGPLAGGYLYDNYDKDLPFQLIATVMLIAMALLGWTASRFLGGENRVH